MARLPLMPKWKCAICGKTVDTALVFALVKDKSRGLVIGECCYDKLEEPGVLMDPGPVFMEHTAKYLEEIAKRAGYKDLDEAVEAFMKEQRGGERESKDPTRLPKGWATVGSDNNKVH